MIDVKAIAEWLREDDYLSLGVDNMGHLIVIETQTGKEINTVTAYMIASLLPLAKKKIAGELSKKYLSVSFREVFSAGTYNCLIMGDNNLLASAKGNNGDLAMLDAVANFIKLERGCNGGV